MEETKSYTNKLNEVIEVSWQSSEMTLKCTVLSDVLDKQTHTTSYTIGHELKLQRRGRASWVDKGREELPNSGTSLSKGSTVLPGPFQELDCGVEGITTSSKQGGGQEGELSIGGSQTSKENDDSHILRRLF